MITALESPAAKLCARWALDGLSIPAVDFGRPVNGSWHGHDLATCATSALQLDADGSVALDLQDPGFVAFADDGGAVENGPTRVTTSTGTLTAPWVLLGSNKSSFEASAGTSSAATIHFEHWAWESGVAPIAWIGELEGWAPAYGNARIDHGTRMKRAQILEGGGLRWFFSKRVVNTGRRSRDSSFVGIEVLDGDLDAERIFSSLRAVEFVLGTRCRLRHLVGVNEQGKPVSALALNHDRARLDGQIRPPLLSGYEGALLQDSFFRKLADAVNPKDVARTFLLTQSYLDSLEHHLDGGYLGLQVALEAFVKGLSKKAKPRLRVRDEDAWLKLVEDLGTCVEQHAREKGDADVLRQVLRDARLESSSQRVTRFFDERGVELPSKVRKEIARRNHVAHEFLMNSNDDARNLDLDLARVTVVQTVLVAVLALHVGYVGPISSGDQRETPCEWWPWHPTERADYRIELPHLP